MPQLDPHPIADIWPMMSDDDVEKLSADIKSLGLLSPVWLYEGKILDGRNRAKACQMAGVKVETKTYTGDNPVAFAFSLNEKRRHLSSGARAALAVEAKPLYEAEAKKRQIRKPASVTQKVEEQNQGKSRNDRQSDGQAAADFGTNRQYVNQAEQVKAQAPEVFEKLKQGKVSMQDAMREVRSKPTNPWLDDEKERKAAVVAGQTVIANAERDKNLVQWAEQKGLGVKINRGSIFGNPFVLNKDGDRNAVCDAYRDHYLPNKPSIQKKLPELKGKVLVCHCYPERCHGEELINGVA